MIKESRVEINGKEFSLQEIAIIQRLKAGLTYQEISEVLGISVRTIDYHIKNLKDKTKAYTKKELLDFFEGTEFSKSDRGGTGKSYGVMIDKSFLKKFGIAFGIMFCMVVFFYPNESKKVENIWNFQDSFLRRPHIEGRIISELNDRSGIRVVVISGTGGAGKTTICRRVLSKERGNIKFEINAETEETLYNSFLELADYLAVKHEQKRELEIVRGLRENEFRKKSLVRFVSERLRESNDWVLLFDNAESFQEIREYFPKNENIWGEGRVLVTTRNQNFGESNFIRQDWVINIGNLEETEKAALFTSIVYGHEFSNLSKVEQGKVREFLRIIPEYPLDVCAAAYYLRNTGISPEEYKKIIKEDGRKLSEEQKRLMQENSSYGETRYGIVSSILKKVVKSTRDRQLLMAIGLMDSQGVPKRILREIAGAIDADIFVRKLKEHSLVTDNGKEISMHRSTHEMGYQYSLENTKKEEREEAIHKLVQSLEKNKKKGSALIPHLESVLKNLSKIDGKEVVADKAKLLIILADIFRNHSYRTQDAYECLNRVMEINKENDCLDSYFEALVKLRLGEICTVMNRNTEADEYLCGSLLYFDEKSMEKVRNYRLLGVVRMRRHEFERANECFETALNLLRHANGGIVKKKLSESNIYEDMSFNYFMDGINRENARKAVPLMRKAIEVLDDPKLKGIEEVTARKAVHQIKLAGIYNALAQYDKALEIAKETENLIDRSHIDNSDTFYVKGLIARERGLSYLRLNRIETAYGHFERAREIFTKLMKGDYLFKLKTHEAECLIRMKKIEEAQEVCLSMIKGKERERNNYSDLFYNTTLYHMAVVKYRLKAFEQSREYFKYFVNAMEVFCRNTSAKENYEKLATQNVFNKNPKILREFFENSLKIFEEIYWKDYEFTKYYVEKNLNMVGFRDR